MLNLVETNEVLEIIDQWLRAYPEEVFPPIRPDERPATPDRVAGVMARHVLTALRRDIVDLAEFRGDAPSDGGGGVVPAYEPALEAMRAGKTHPIPPRRYRANGGDDAQGRSQ